MKTDKIPAKGLLFVLIAWSAYMAGQFGMVGIGTYIPYMMEQFGISLETAGYFSTVTSLGQVLLHIPLGIVASRVKPKYSMGFIFICTVGAFLCHAMANGPALVFVGRALIAASLSGIVGVLVMIKSSWIPVSRITRVSGFEQLASTSGQFLGTTCTAALVLVLGNWQNVMWVLTIIIAIFMVLWFILYKDNPDNPVQKTDNEPFFSSLKEAVCEKCTWMLAFGWVGKGLVWIAMTTYWPTYAIQNLGLSEAQAGVAIGMIPVGSMVGCLVGPTIANAIGRDKPLMIIGGLIMAGTYAGAMISGSLVVASICFFLEGIISYTLVTLGLSQLYKLGTVSPGAVAVGNSVILTMANVGGTLAGIIVAAMMQSLPIKVALLTCCLSPLLWSVLIIFVPERGRKWQEKQRQSVN